MFEKQINLTGKDKVALFLASIGTTNTKGMLKYFSTAELHKMRMALKKVKVYTPAREIRVLEEAVRLGLNKRLCQADPVVLNQGEYAVIHANDARYEERQEQEQYYTNNADAVAGIINKWISDDNKNG